MIPTISDKNYKNKSIDGLKAREAELMRHTSSDRTDNDITTTSL